VFAQYYSGRSINGQARSLSDHQISGFPRGGFVLVILCFGFVRFFEQLCVSLRRLEHTGIALTSFEPSRPCLGVVYLSVLFVPLFQLHTAAKFHPTTPSPPLATYRLPLSPLASRISHLASGIWALLPIAYRAPRRVSLRLWSITACKKSQRSLMLRG
jgi:hypothetical protein